MKKQLTFNQQSPLQLFIPKTQMVARLGFYLLLFLYWSQAAMAQAGSIQGIVTDEIGEGLISATVIIVDATGRSIGIGAVTDFDGNYSINHLKAGSYDFQFSYAGYTAQIMKRVSIKDSMPTFLNIKMKPSENVLNCIEILCYKVPMIDRSSTFNWATTSQVHRLRTSKSSKAGAYQEDVSSGVSIRGGREDGIQYYINGVKVIGKPSVPIDMGELAPPFRKAVEVPKEQDKMGTEEFNAIVENEFLSTSRSSLSTFSIDVDGASYTLLRKKLQSHYPVPRDAIRVEEMINYFPYEYKDATAEIPFSVQTELGTCPWDTSHVLLKIGIQGKKIATDHLPKSNLVFLVDVSGSMSYNEKLPLVQKALTLLVEQMKPDDKISLVVYAGNAGLVLPPTLVSDKLKIVKAINELSAGGSTAGGQGIKLAYKAAIDNFVIGGNNRVVLCTDGDFNVGISSDADLISLIEEKRENGVFLSVFGFGMGNYKDGKMEQLANKGNGVYAYIDNEKEAYKNMVSQMGANFITIAKDVKIQTVFNPTAVRSYRLIGYENRTLADKDFSDDKIDAGEIGAGANVTALYELVLSKDRKAVSVLLAKKDKEMAELSDENLMLVRIRYKNPTENKSNLIEQGVGVEVIPLVNTSNDFRFAAAVACFGMLVRESKYSGNYTWDKVVKLATDAKSEDKEGYRAEMIELVKLAASASLSAQAK